MVGTVQTIQGKKYETDNGQLIEKEPTSGTEWNTVKENKKEDFLWELGPEWTHQKTRCKNQTEAVNTDLAKLIKVYKRYYLPNKNKKKSQGDLFG